MSFFLLGMLLVSCEKIQLANFIPSNSGGNESPIDQLDSEKIPFNSSLEYKIAGDHLILDTDVTIDKKRNFAFVIDGNTSINLQSSTEIAQLGLETEKKFLSDSAGNFLSVSLDNEIEIINSNSTPKLRNRVSSFVLKKINPNAIIDPAFTKKIINTKNDSFTTVSSDSEWTTRNLNLFFEQIPNKSFCAQVSCSNWIVLSFRDASSNLPSIRLKAIDSLNQNSNERLTNFIKVDLINNQVEELLLPNVSACASDNGTNCSALSANDIRDAQYPLGIKSNYRKFVVGQSTSRTIYDTLFLSYKIPTGRSLLIDGKLAKGPFVIYNRITKEFFNFFVEWRGDFFSHYTTTNSTCYDDDGLPYSCTLSIPVYVFKINSESENLALSYANDFTLSDEISISNFKRESLVDHVNNFAFGLVFNKTNLNAINLSYRLHFTNLNQTTEWVSPDIESVLNTTSQLPSNSPSSSIECVATNASVNQRCLMFTYVNFLTLSRDRKAKLLSTYNFNQSESDMISDLTESLSSNQKSIASSFFVSSYDYYQPIGDLMVIPFSDSISKKIKLAVCKVDHLGQCLSGQIEFISTDLFFQNYKTANNLNFSFINNTMTYFGSTLPIAQKNDLAFKEVIQKYKISDLSMVAKNTLECESNEYFGDLRAISNHLVLLSAKYKNPGTDKLKLLNLKTNIIETVDFKFEPAFDQSSSIFQTIGGKFLINAPSATKVNGISYNSFFIFDPKTKEVTPNINLFSNSTFWDVFLGNSQDGTPAYSRYSKVNIKPTVIENKIIVSGAFDSINGQTRYGMAMLDNNLKLTEFHPLPISFSPLIFSCDANANCNSGFLGKNTPNFGDSKFSFVGSQSEFIFTQDSNLLDYKGEVKRGDYLLNSTTGRQVSFQAYSPPSGGSQGTLIKKTSEKLVSNRFIASVSATTTSSESGNSFIRAQLLTDFTFELFDTLFQRSLVLPIFSSDFNQQNSEIRDLDIVAYKTYIILGFSGTANKGLLKLVAYKVGEQGVQGIYDLSSVVNKIAADSLTTQCFDRLAQKTECFRVKLVPIDESRILVSTELHQKIVNLNELGLK